MNKGKFERLDLSEHPKEIKDSAKDLQKSFDRVDQANADFRKADQERKIARIENSNLVQQFAAELDTHQIEIDQAKEIQSDEIIKSEGV